MTDVQRLAFAAADYESDYGRWPELAELFAAGPCLPRRDPWQHAFRCESGGDRFVVRSAGLDGVFDTPDDVVSDGVEASSPPRR
ncbi:MAG TPA: hypothetical protein VFZ65_21060 [Planctomycetota bacterium]|nr:hypothetical protein [Planctomycetota bacterium]